MTRGERPRSRSRAAACAGLLALGITAHTRSAAAGGLELRLQASGSAVADSWTRNFQQGGLLAFARTERRTQESEISSSLRVVLEGGDMKETVLEESWRAGNASGAGKGGYRLFKGADGRTLAVDPERKSYAELPPLRRGFPAGTTVGSGLARITYRFSAIQVRLESLPPEPVLGRECLHERIVATYVEEIRPATPLSAGGWTKRPARWEADVWVDPGAAGGAENAAALLRFRGLATSSAEANALVDDKVKEIATKGFPIRFRLSVSAESSALSAGSNLRTSGEWTVSELREVDVPDGELDVPDGFARTEPESRVVVTYP